MTKSISEPFINGNEIKEIKNTINKNEVSSYGKLIKKFENKISKLTKIKHVVACSSGTAGLHVALKVLGVEEGDEVLVPTITFIATINVVRYLGAKPIFFDCDNDYNINSKKVLIFLKNNTYFKNGFSYNKKTHKIIKAIIPVHVWGNPADILKLTKVCRQKNIKILEDASEAFGSFYKNQKSVGSIGDIGVFSFNGNKIITTGNGGAIVTNKKKYDRECRYFIAQATDLGSEFIHNNVGYNYRFSALNAAFGLGQLSKIKFYIKKKRNIHKLYSKFFSSLKKFNLFSNKSYPNSNCWMNILQFDPKLKFKVINLLRKNNIQIKFVWKPNHLQKPFQKFQKYKISNLSKYYNGSICLPSSVSLNEKQIKKITNIFKSI